MAPPSLHSVGLALRWTARIPGSLLLLAALAVDLLIAAMLTMVASHDGVERERPRRDHPAALLDAVLLPQIVYRFIEDCLADGVVICRRHRIWSVPKE